MAKVKSHLINKKEKAEIVGEFYEIVSGLKSKREIIDFFVGLFSVSETLMIARRIQIAQMLLNGKSYDEIRQKVKASNQTITKTDQWLHSGDEKYDKWLEKCVKSKKLTNVKNKINNKGVLEKYPQHRFLKELLG